MLASRNEWESPACEHFFYWKLRQLQINFKSISISEIPEPSIGISTFLRISRKLKAGGTCSGENKVKIKLTETGTEKKILERKIWRGYKLKLRFSDQKYVLMLLAECLCTEYPRDVSSQFSSKSLQGLLWQKYKKILLNKNPEPDIKVKPDRSEE